jgi:hypothetical protein
MQLQTSNLSLERDSGVTDTTWCQGMGPMLASTFVAGNPGSGATLAQTLLHG